MLINSYRYATTGGGSTDSDAQAFITATGISDTTIENALHALVIGLKADGIWSKCVAIYPFVGGDATKHSYNLRNTANHQITWNGTVTHNANGITGNGSTGYGDLNLNPSAHMSLNDNHIAVYSRTNSAANSHEIGLRHGGGTGHMYLGCRWSSGQLNYCSGVGASEHFTAVARSDGFFVGTRRSATDTESYRHGTTVANDADSNASGTLQAVDLYICARSIGGTAESFSSRNLAFASVGSGLTDTEVSNYATRVETFQDALSRGVI